MAGSKGFVLVALVIAAMVAVCCGEAKHRPFSSLENTLTVKAEAKTDQVLVAGVDTITFSWGLNKASKAGSTDKTYKTVKVKLCFAAISQVDRPWRKTNLENIAKDKTCQYTMISEKYKASTSTGNYTIKKDIPGASYFVRVYAFDSDNKEVAYGQTTDAAKKKNIFKIAGITGRTTSIDVAAGVFSTFSVVSLAYFFYMEKKKARRAT